MVSIIPMDPSKIKTDLPLELVKPIFVNADLQSYIVKLDENKQIIRVYDFNTIDIIREVTVPYTYHMSVSKCGKFIVCSDTNTVRILNFDDFSVIQEIPVEFIPIHDEEQEEYCYVRSERNGEPVHTFTINNQLLIACSNSIRSYSYNDNRWNEIHHYTLPDSQIIVKITANLSLNMFACGTLYGDVYVFNANSHNLIRDFTTRFGLLRADCYPEILSLTFNNNILVTSTASGNNLILNLDTNTTTVVQVPTFKRAHITNFLLTPCVTKFIGYSLFANSVYLWDAITGEIIKTLDIYMDQQEAVFSKYSLITFLQEDISKYNLNILV